MTQDIRFEVWTPREAPHHVEPLLPGIRWPKSFNFGDSLKRLKKKGFDRHPSTSELLRLVSDGIEGKVGFFNKLALRDMLYPDSAMTQWVDLALEIVGNELVVHYGNIDGLVLCDTDGSADYRKSGFRRDNEARFDISKCISENIQDEGHNREYSVLPKNLPTPLIEILYGKNFSGMPESLQSYIMEQFCFIPRGEGIYPLSLTASTEVVPRLGYSAYAASRGVRLK